LPKPAPCCAAPAVTPAFFAFDEATSSLTVTRDASTLTAPVTLPAPQGPRAP
jgi:hypothetical protein